MGITHTFEGLTNGLTYYAKVFTINPSGRVNNRVDLPYDDATPMGTLPSVVLYYDGEDPSGLTGGFEKCSFYYYHEYDVSEPSDKSENQCALTYDLVDTASKFDTKVMCLDVTSGYGWSYQRFAQTVNPIDLTDVASIEITGSYVKSKGNFANDGISFGVVQNKENVTGTSTNDDFVCGVESLHYKYDDSTQFTHAIDCSAVTGNHYLRFDVSTGDRATNVKFYVAKIVVHYK